MDNITMESTKTKAFAMLLLSGAVALAGCSQNQADAETLASEQEREYEQTINDYDYRSSRNNGSWGAVYMTREELAGPQIDVVDFSDIPSMAEDAEVQKWDQVFGDSNAFHSTNGAELYHRSCAGCHMHQGEGAYGAGYYPPLANNSKMESNYYIVDILINGFRGMPAFHAMMDNEQIAAVTQYVHSELNDYTDTITAEDVAKLRHDNPPAGAADPTE